MDIYMKIFIIFLLALYQYNIMNRLEKKTIKNIYNNDLIKRPLKECIDTNNIKCLGMPSGHTETITIISLLLYHIKIISLPVAVLLVLIIGFQRIITNMHTPLQVLAGFIFGLFYTFLYIKCNLSYICFIYLGLITLILSIFLLYKSELFMNAPIPLWVDKSMGL